MLDRVHITTDGREPSRPADSFRALAIAALVLIGGGTAVSAAAPSTTTDAPARIVDATTIEAPADPTADAADPAVAAAAFVPVTIAAEPGRPLPVDP
jgi:hypothetical protein